MYYSYNKEPPHKNSIGNYLGTYINEAHDKGSLKLSGLDGLNTVS